MPVIKSAKKKLRKDRKLQKVNQVLKNKLSAALKDAKKSKTHEKVRIATKLTDLAAKKKLIHKNKAARIKSSLSKLAKHTKTSTSTKTKPKKASKK